MSILIKETYENDFVMQRENHDVIIAIGHKKLLIACTNLYQGNP